ncbi:MAG: ABC-three component system protein [Solibacillus sp.]
MGTPINFVTNNVDSHKENLILFIHGFTSNSKTWENVNGTKFSDFLLEDNIIKENFDIAYFEYFTKLMDFSNVRLVRSITNILLGKGSNSKKNIGIEKLSDFLKSSIETYCRAYKNIILVAHSMGGLISKSYILNELELIGETKVKLFISLAVPHKGSNWATIGKKLKLNNSQVVDLVPLSEFLDETTSRWIKNHGKLPKTIYYYGHFDDIVDEQSAVGYEVETGLKVSCDNDHFNISKPENVNSMVCRSVTNNLNDFQKELSYSIAMNKIEFTNDGKLDDEIFVLKLLLADVHNKIIKDSKETFFEAEYMLKVLLSSGYSMDDLKQLYKNLERLYLLNFMKLTEGTIKSSTELVTTIYEEIIKNDNNFLNITIPLIDANKKTGMLNQLANNLDKDIWWAKENCIKDLETLRKEKQRHGR